MARRLAQFSNAKLPMLVTVAGIETTRSAVQSRNALLPMLVVPSGTAQFVRLPGQTNTSAWFRSRRNLFVPLYAVFAGSTVIVVRLLHAANAPFPILVTKAGIKTAESCKHWAKAKRPMLVTPGGMTRLVKPSL